MRYFLGGVNGSGKTTLLAKIKEVRPDMIIIKGSEVFMEFLGIPGDYEALRRFPHDQAMMKLEEMITMLMQQYDSMIIDSHYLNLVRGNVKSVTGDWIKNFDALLLLQVSPGTLLQRVFKDLRDRALFPENTTDEQASEMYSAYAKEYEQEFQRLANVWHRPAKILDGGKSIDEIVKEFIVFDQILTRRAVH